MEDNANTRQIAGTHYVKYGNFQIWDAWWHWNLDPFQANVIKYVVRGKEGGLKKKLEDLDKAVHYIEKYKELLIAEEEQRKAKEEAAQVQIARATPSEAELAQLKRSR